MSAIFKTLTGIIPSNQTAIVFTDNMILEDSILDVFFSNDDIVVDDMTMSGNSVTVTISPQNYNVGVALFINNCEVFTPYDDTEVLNRLTIVETDTDTLNTEVGELDTEVGELNTELDTLTNTVNNKQDKLPEIVNDRYLHTNETTGDLEWVSVQGGTSFSFKKIYENNNLAINTPITIENLNKYDFIVIQVIIGRASTIIVPNNGASTNYNISHYDGSSYRGYQYYNVNFVNNTITCTERNVVPSSWLSPMVVVYGCSGAINS